MGSLHLRSECKIYGYKVVYGLKDVKVYNERNEREKVDVIVPLEYDIGFIYN